VAEHWRLIGPTMEQPQYNLFERNKIENEFLPLYDRVGLGTTIWSPLASGLLSGKYNEGIPADSRFGLKGFEWLSETWMEKEKIDKVKQLSQVARSLGTTTAALSIAWCIKNPHVTCAILGATKKEQLVDNLKALDVVAKLTPEIIDSIEKIMKTKPVLPQF
jgi:aryl-alcohol dehydrogenase-like predicted oxidoreductase